LPACAGAILGVRSLWLEGGLADSARLQLALLLLASPQHSLPASFRTLLAVPAPTVSDLDAASRTCQLACAVFLPSRLGARLARRDDLVSAVSIRPHVQQRCRHEAADAMAGLQCGVHPLRINRWGNLIHSPNRNARTYPPLPQDQLSQFAIIRPSPAAGGPCRPVQLGTPHQLSGAGQLNFALGSPSTGECSPVARRAK
jgi:hypothetical protein